MIDREQELEATNQLLETVLEHTHVLVAVLDPQFNFVRVNRAYAEADQRAPDYFPGKNHFDLYPNVENRRIFERVLETGEPYFAFARPFEYTEHPERGVSYWDWSLAPIANQHGPVRGLVLTLADVTERVRTQQTLQESEAWLELAIAGSNGGLWYVELDPDDPEHALPDGIYLSPRLKRFIGYADDELPNSVAAWESRVLPEDLPRLRESSERHRQGQTELHELEYRIRHRDGSIRWLHTCGRMERDGDGQPLRFAGMDWDITERKSAESVLREQTRQLGERVKELNCLFEISRLIEHTGISLPEILQGTVDLLPPAWQYPEVTCACIALGDQQYSTANYDQRAPWCQAADLVVSSQREGKVEICYLEDRPLSDEGPFLSEERHLLNTIAARLSRAIERHRAEAALAESEAKFRNLADQSPNMIFINQGGRVVYVNRECEQALGYTRNEFYAPGFDFLSLIAPESRDLVQVNSEAHMRGEDVPPYEYALVTKDGRRIDAILASKLIRYESQSAILGVVTDVTEHKRTEALAAYERDLMQALLNNIPDYVYFKDKDRRFVRASASFCGLFHCSLQEIIGKRDEDLFPAEIARETAADDRAVMETGTPLINKEEGGESIGGQAHWVLTTKLPWYDKDGNIVGLFGLSREITERRQAVESLRRERDLVARIMVTSPVGIVVLDRQGRIIFANAQVQEMTGLSREQIIQLDYNDPTWRMVGDNGRTLADELLPFPQVLRSGQPIYNLQQAVDLPGQPRLLLSMNAAPLYDATGQVDGVVITIEDVTERERLQEQVQRHAAELEQRVAERTAELQASQEALLQAERLAIAGRLAASLTHEISNPLQSVIGCLGLAEETLAEGGDVDQYLDIALPELRRIARIVARLRNLGRPPAFRAAREPTDVGALLEQVLALSQKQCQDRDIETELEVADDLPQALTAPDQMQQVFLNLLLNALDASTAGGVIEIRARSTRQPDGLSVQFADDGTGISPNVLPHIFDPFYSTKPDGLGLGLFVSQDIVRQHGGHIEVESQLGAGTRFTVWLPV